MRFYNRLTQPVLRRPVELAQHPAITVMDEWLRAGTRAIVEGWFQRIEGEIAPQRARHAPAHDPPGEDVDHEGDVREAPPRRHVGQIRDPQLIRARRHEAPGDEIGRTHGAGVRARRALELSTARYTLQS